MSFVGHLLFKTYLLKHDLNCLFRICITVFLITTTQYFLVPPSPLFFFLVSGIFTRSGDRGDGHYKLCSPIQEFRRLTAGMSKYLYSQRKSLLVEAKGGKNAEYGGIKGGARLNIYQFVGGKGDRLTGGIAAQDRCPQLYTFSTLSLLCSPSLFCPRSTKPMAHFFTLSTFAQGCTLQQCTRQK